MPKRKNDFGAGGYGRRRQTLQIDNARREPAPWEDDGAADPFSEAPAQAGEGAVAPVGASGQVWQEVPDPESGDIYYWNIRTGETRWDKPAESSILPAAAASAPQDHAGSADAGKEEAAAGAEAVDRTAGAVKTNESQASEVAPAVSANAALSAFDYGSDSDEAEAPASSSTSTQEVSAGAADLANGKGQNAASAPEAEEDSCMADVDSMTVGGSSSGAEGTQKTDVAEAGEGEDGAGGNSTTEEEDCTAASRKPVAFAMPKPKAAAQVDVAKGKLALQALRPVKDSDVDDFLAHLDVVSPDKPSHPTPWTDTAGSDQEAKQQQQQQQQQPQDAAAGGQGAAEPMQEEHAGQTSGGDGGGGGGGVEPESSRAEGSVAGAEAEAGAGAAVSAGGAAAGCGSDAISTELIGRVCFEVLTLKREGDDVIDALKAAIAEEESPHESRRDVLLTLLGGMLSWSGLLSDLGILVSEEMTAGFARAVDVIVPKLRQRLSKCTEALAAQSELRQAAHSEVLPEGWHKAVAAHDASALYYRLGAGASEGVLQTAPPPNTRLQPLAAYGASPDALPDAPDHDSAEQSASDQLPEYEPAHAKTMAALPAGSGELCESSMLLYLAPDTNCNVGYMLELFAPQQRFITHIRVIGGGFVAVTFDSELTCQQARDQALVDRRGQQRAYPPMRLWTVLTRSTGEDGGVYARLAAADDQVDRYPLHFSQLPPSDQAHAARGNEHAAAGAEAGGDPFADADSSGIGPGVHLATDACRAEAGERKKLVQTKGKVSAPKAKAKYNQQIQKWKQKQEELMPHEDDGDGPMSLEQLEAEKKRKAAEWYEQQMASGEGGNPNLMPLNNPNLMPLNKAPGGGGGGGFAFAVPAPRAKQAGWRDRLAGKQA